MAWINLLQNSPFAAAMADHPLVLFDLGARGGIDRDLETIAFATDVVGFEPDPTEYSRMVESGTGAGAWRSLRYLPCAVGRDSGRHRLNITTDPQSSSLLEPDAAIGAWFDKPQFFSVERRVAVETLSLADAVDRSGLALPDILKLDVEGAELDVLQGGEAALANAVAVKTEVSFMRFRKGQPVFADLDAWLRDRGFVLMDLGRFAHWRRQGYVVHPQVDTTGVIYSRGQIAQGDALYFRAPATLAGADAATLSQRLKAAFVAIAFGYFDHAGALFADPAVADRLRGDYGVDPAAALRRTSRLVARHACLRAVVGQLRALRPFVRTAARLMR